MPVRTMSRLSEIAWRSPRWTKHGKIKSRASFFSFVFLLVSLFVLLAPFSLFLFKASRSMYFKIFKHSTTQRGNLYCACKMLLTFA